MIPRCAWATRSASIASTPALGIGLTEDPVRCAKLVDWFELG